MSNAMTVFYHDHFVLPLPPGHRFPMSKYQLLRTAVAKAGFSKPGSMKVGPAATNEQLLRAHTKRYVAAVQNGTLSAQEMRRIGFPWSPQLVIRSGRSVGSTVAAAEIALKEGIAVSLAGGTHHAGPDWGQGYCVFNDSVVAARAVQAIGLARRVVILDCDVHQGNGTAAITVGDPSIFTFSIHGAKNFPFRKFPSDLDIGLADGTADSEYLEALARGIRVSLERSEPDLAIYLAGADPFVGDRLGRLSLSKPGLAQRDRLVLESCMQVDVPVAVTMAGGYGHEVKDTVDIHFQTVSIAAAVWATLRN